MAAKSFLYASPSLTGHGPEPAPIVDLFSGSGDTAIVVAQWIDAAVKQEIFFPILEFYFKSIYVISI